ncbi:hypothetical protein NADFUDRAFT_43296 [Nadsonia fulvescens var. elongata DSM 6958]|uniref:UDP-N-acetylglucosamine transferase subunit ALG13 n=1 Tax=Nadsonia fulvescens var. elongata DSM 6958 TaxID=857566 RepID=A0A1E3PG48_9ASCO|nr:hypothetical protein NADFUDRAFT_43296 [Nadsonia fulvescens var. elongata DSM 6958]
MSSGKTVFVTVGATVPFDEMIQLVLATRSRQLLHDQGFRHLVIQHGHRDEKKWSNIIQGVELDDTWTDLVKEFELDDTWTLDSMAYSEDITSLINQADLVISHAGTGSILDALRLQKPLVVVVNSQLMDNHQLEVAHEFSQGGYLLYSLVDQVSFECVLAQVPKFRFQTLPEASPSIIPSIIDQETFLLS